MYSVVTQMKLHTHTAFSRQRGDTLIEVLIATVIIASVLIGAFSVTRASTRQTGNAKEQSQAASYLQAEVEKLRAGIEGTERDDFFDTTSFPLYCVANSGGSVIPVKLDGITTLPDAKDDPLATSGTPSYPAECVQGRYFISITPPADPDIDSTFTLRARWITQNSETAESIFYYRLYPTVTSTAPVASCPAPSDVVLVLDTSGSMNQSWGTPPNTRFREMKAVAKTFVDATIASSGNLEALVSFDSTGTIESGFTGDATLLKNRIDSLATHHDTRYARGLDQAITLFQTQGRPGSQKIIVFVSDGRADDPALAEARANALKGGSALGGEQVAIFTIGINPDSEDFVELEAMKGGEVVGVTGVTEGYFVEAVNSGELLGLMAGVANGFNCP